jgi:hypothetical protein
MDQPMTTPKEDAVAQPFRVRNQDHVERLNAARQQVRDHPAAHLVAQAETLRQSIDAIFIRNFAMVRSLLIAPTKDPGLAIELTQNVRRSVVAEEHIAGLVLHLHNYLAGSYTLAEHVRTLMARQPDELKERWNDERGQRFGSDEMRFVGDLRRYIQHYAHLPIYSEIAFASAAAAVQDMKFATGLETRAMLRWNDWTSPARSYLERQDVIELVPLLDTHASTTVAANRWLLNEIVTMITPLVDEYNELVVRANAVLTGLDLEAAKRLTEEQTRQRNSTQEPPNPF